MNKWLIVGTGWISSEFVKNLKYKKEHVHGIMSRTKENATKFAQENDIEHTFTSLKDNFEEITHVYIGTPNIAHYETTKFFLNLKKDVLVEKIMTHDPKHTKELFDLADKNGVKVMEAFVHIYPERLHEYQNKKNDLKVNFMQLSSKIKKGIADKASSFRKDTYGGVMPCLAVYPLSLAILLNGSVKEIIVNDLKMYKDEVEIDVSYTLHHKNGSITQSRASKIEDGDNSVYINGKKVSEHVSEAYKEYRMEEEIELFLNGDYKFSREISLEVASLVKQVKDTI